MQHLCALYYLRQFERGFGSVGSQFSHLIFCHALRDRPLLGLAGHARRLSPILGSVLEQHTKLGVVGFKLRRAIDERLKEALYTAHRRARRCFDAQQLG